MVGRALRALVVTAVVVAGCGIGTPGSPSLTTPVPATLLPSGYVTIATLSGQVPEGPNPACADEYYYDAILHGDPAAKVPVWIEPLPEFYPDLGRVEVIWPHGFSARFTPDLELLDPEGTVIGREGDRLRDLAGRQDTPTLWVIWWVNGKGYSCW